MYCAGQFGVFSRNIRKNFNALNDECLKISMGHGLERIFSE